MTDVCELHKNVAIKMVMTAIRNLLFDSCQKPQALKKRVRYLIDVINCLRDRHSRIDIKNFLVVSHFHDVYYKPVNIPV